MIKERTVKINDNDYQWLVRTKKKTCIPIKHLISVAIDFLQQKHESYNGKK